jgi:hypothetical protein
MRQVTAIILAATFAVTGEGLRESVWAQELQRQAPKTQLEAFTGEIGAVIIKGYTEIGSVSGSGRIEVTAMTFRNAKSAQEKSGILVEVKGAGSYAQNGRSLIDYEEINGLLDGISYVTKVQKSDTKLRNFEAIYSTKGDLKVVVFNDASGKKSASIQVGSIGSHQAFINMENLAQFARLIIKARDILDHPESAVEAATPSPQPVIPAAPPRPTPAAKSTPKQLPTAKPPEPSTPMRLN